MKEQRVRISKSEDKLSIDCEQDPCNVQNAPDINVKIKHGERQ